MSPDILVVGCGMLFIISIGVIGFLFRGTNDQEQLTSRSHTSGGLRSNYSRSSSSTSQEQSQVTSRLVQAGLYRRNSVSYYVLVKAFLSILPVGLGAALGTTGVITVYQGLALGAVLGLIATVLPGFWLDAKKQSRQTSIRRALPDALDVIVVCLEAGLSLRAALSRVAKELRGAHPMLAAELLIAEREIQLGQPAGEALEHFADRFDLEELRSLASVVKQAEKFGASVAHALRVHADGLRVRRFQMAEEKAQKANVKLLFPTMFLIFPTLYVVLLGPAVMQISEFFSTFGK